MVRRMAEAAYREQQHRDRYAAHVRPINEMVDELRDPDGRGWMPYVAPSHGGVAAWVLTVLRDPGPATQDDLGSGFLCVENNDPTAEQQCRAFAEVGVAPSDFTPWNAYPWYINRKPTAAERDAGVAPLVRLLAMMPDLAVVLLQGNDARETWHRLCRTHPLALAGRRLAVIETYHPGRQALWSPDPAERERRRQARVSAYQQVGALRS